MLATRYFVEQLTGRTPVETLRIQAARTERIRLPTRSASFFFVRLRGIPSGRVKGCRNGLSAAAA